MLPTTQGLVLFSADQQFLMSAANGILTPSTTTVRAIANYQTDLQVRPVDTGTTLNFVSKTPSYTRVFAMVTRGENENPSVIDIGRIVNEWVPASVDTMISSPQNVYCVLRQSSRYICSLELMVRRKKRTSMVLLVIAVMYKLLQQIQTNFLL